jgi:hypothetical protein
MADDTANPYAADAADYVQGKVTATRLGLYNAANTNPQQEAEYRQLAAATQTPLDTVRNMADTIRAQAAASSVDVASLVQQYPKTAALAASDAAGVMHDDVPGTANVERYASSLGQSQIDIDSAKYGSLVPGPPPTYRERLSAWLRDLVGLPPAGRDEAAAARAFLDVTAKQLGTNREGLREAVGGMSPVPQQFAQGFFDSFLAGLMPDQAGQPDTTAGSVARGGGQLAGFVLGLPLRIGSMVAEHIPGLAPTVGQSFVKGLGRDVARQAATLGIASGITATGKALDTSTPEEAASTVAHETATGAATGAVFGAAGRLFPDNTAAQTVARALGISATLDAMQGTRPWDDRPIAQKVFDYGLNTVFALDGAGRVGGGWLHDAARADTAAQDGQMLQGLADAAAESKLRERDPDTFKQFVADASQDAPVQAVYVDGTKLAEVLHQGGVGMDELGGKLPDVAQQLPEALSTGGMVRIPVEDFATHIAGGPLQEPLMPHLRTDPEGMTLAESQAFFQSHHDELAAVAAQAADLRGADQAAIDSRQQVFDAIKSQVDATGRFPAGVSDAYAALHSAFYSTMADRLGMLPHELLDQYPVHIASESLSPDTLSAPEQRGAYEPTSKTIAILKGADLSTFLHESGHHFLDALSHMAAEPSAPEEVKADMRTLLQSFGVADLDAWHRMPLEEQRAGHEQFARGFEQYLMEGKSPDLEMRGLFARFRAWLTHVYKTLTGLKVELSPEVRGVMDRMLASSDAIRQAEAARHYMPLFDSPEKAAMSPEQWAQYQALGKEATATAVENLTAKTVRDMAFLDRTRSKALKALAKDAADKRKTIEREVRAEVMSQPVYRAWSFLTGRDKEADPNDPTLGAGKFNSTDLEQRVMASPEVVERLRDLGMVAKSSAEGLHPDVVAEMFGFGSGHELINALIQAEHPKDVVRALTDQRMLERHGEIATPEALARAADEAVHNEVRARFIATELRTLKKAVGPERELVKAAQDVAQTVIDGKRVREINERQFTVIEARAARQAEERLAAGDTGGAAVAKRDQLLNNQLARSAREAADYIDKALDYAKKFDKASVRQALDGQFLEQIDGILAGIDLRVSPSGTNPAANRLLNWAQGLREAGYEPQIADWLGELRTPKSYRDLTFAEFRGAIDAIKSLEHIAREQRKAMVHGQAVDIRELVDQQLVPRMKERGQRFTREQLIEPPRAKVDGYWAALTHWLGVKMRLVDADLKPQEFKFNRYDLHEIDGPFRQALFDQLLEANYRKVDLTKQVSDVAGKVGQELGKDWQHSLYDLVENQTLGDPDLSQPGKPVAMKITRGRMLGIARHVGNESNFDKLCRGYGWAPADVWRFLDKNMTAKDWQATQAHWDSFEPLWEETDAMIRRLGGVPPPKIEARAFDTRFGHMRGGYSPIDYEPLRSKLSVRQGEFTLEPGERVGDAMVYRATTTRNGSLNARAEGYTDRVSLDFHQAEARIRDTIHDLAYREALLDATKIVNDRTFRETFEETYGREEYAALVGWLKSIRDQNAVDPRTRGFDKAMQWTRQGVVLTGIGYRVSTVLKHGGAAALKSLGYLGNAEGAKYFAARVARMASGHMQEDVAGARQKFAEIRTRMLQMDRDYREGNRSMYEAVDWRAKNDRFGHMMVAWSDALSAVPTAWAAYDLARTSGVPKSMGGTGEPMSEDDAVRYANSIVRQAHGSALEVTRSNFMQARGAKGFFGALYGFMNNTYGQMGDMLDKSVSGGHFQNNPAVAARLFATLLIPAVWAQWLRSGTPSDDESWWQWTAKAVAGEVAAMVPFVRDAAALLEHGRAGTVAPMQAMTDVVNAGRDLWNEAHGQSTRLIQDLSNAVGEWAHIAGLGQLGHILQYMRDTAEGKHHPDNAAQAAKEAVVGGAKH